MSIAQRATSQYQPGRHARWQTNSKLILATALFFVLAGNIPLTGDAENQPSGYTAVVRAAGLGAGMTFLLLGLVRQPRSDVRQILVWLFPFFLFLFYCMLSAAWSLEPNTTLIRGAETSVTVIFSALWTQAVVRLCNSGREVCTWIALGILAVVAYGIIVNTVFFGDPIRIVVNREESERARLVFGNLHPLAVADILAIGTVATIMSDLRWLRKAGALLALLPLLFLTDATGPRILVAGIFLIYAGVVTIRIAGLSRAIVLLPIFGIIAILGVAIIFSLDSPLIQKFSDNQRIWTLTGRTQLWSVIWDSGLASTWFGTGFDAARGAILDIFGIAYQVHNQYFAILVELGYFGLILFVPIFLAWIIPLIKSRNIAIYCFALYILGINIDHASMFTKTWLIFLTIFSYIMALELTTLRTRLRASPAPRNMMFSRARALAQ